jgi:putative Mn2+ efflux pump MntP
MCGMACWIGGWYSARMPFLTLLLTGFGLAMDAVAVSISSGMTPVVPRRRDAAKMALWFGAFQAIMPAVGYSLGVAFNDWIADFDHWVAFGLLSFIGVKMIREARAAYTDATERADPFSARHLTMLAIATSVDALAVGISFSLLETGLLQTVTIIGITTFALCYPAVLLGRRLGEVFSKRAELVGGLVLVGIGVKILVEHTLLG